MPGSLRLSSGRVRHTLAPARPWHVGASATGLLRGSAQEGLKEPLWKGFCLWSCCTWPSCEAGVGPKLPSSGGPGAAAWPGSSSCGLASGDWAAPTKAGESSSWPPAGAHMAVSRKSSVSRCPWSQPVGCPWASLSLRLPARLRFVVFSCFSFRLTFSEQNHVTPL